MGIIFSNEQLLNKNIRNLENDNRELKKQIDSLKNINNISQQKLDVLINKQSNNEKINNKDKKKISDISKKKIKDHVDKILENSDTNISYLPDFVERKIYENIFGIVLNLLDDILETTSIKLIGHEISFDLKEDKNN